MTAASFPQNVFSKAKLSHINVILGDMIEKPEDASCISHRVTDEAESGLLFPLDITL